MKKIRRNYYLIFIDTILFANAMVFLSINAVIPSFLTELGSNTFCISLANALVSIGSFVTQPIFAQIAMNLPIKHRVFAKILILQRIIFIAYVFFIPFLARVGTQISIILFLIFWGIFNLFVGAYSPFFMSIFSKIIDSGKRGRLVGYSGAVGNIIALGATSLVGIILRGIIFPFNYTWIFGLGTFLLLLDGIIFVFVQEPLEPVNKRDISYIRYIKGIPGALKASSGFSKAVLGNSLIVMSNISLAYYTLYAIRKFGAGPTHIAAFTSISVIINTLGNTVFGILADRHSHRHVLKWAAAFGAIAMLVILGATKLYAVYIAFALSSICYSGYFISSSINIMQNSPEDQVPIYISINIMITLVISSIVTILSGVVIDNFSFTPVFIFTGFCAILGFILFSHDQWTRVRKNSN